MHIAIFFMAAVAGYLIGSVNISIVLSRLVYHEDIRTRGSGNPGFTNFKRLYGNKLAWFVFLFDLLKGAGISMLFGWLFQTVGHNWQLGVAFTGAFVMLGNSYPVWYKFKGGKGFLVLLSVLFILDWRVGLGAFALMAILLLTVKYMSVSTMTALTVGAIVLFPLGTDIPAAIIYCVCVAFMIYRHKTNIVRLIHGEESKFSLGKKKN